MQIPGGTPRRVGVFSETTMSGKVVVSEVIRLHVHRSMSPACQALASVFPWTTVVLEAARSVPYMPLAMPSMSGDAKQTSPSDRGEGTTCCVIFL